MRNPLNRARKPKVLCCLLCGTERQHWINPDLTMMLFRMAKDPRFDVEVATVKDAVPYEVARNHTIQIARDHGFEWLVSFDNDNFMPTATPLDVITVAGPQHRVIGLTYGVPTEGKLYNFYPPLQYRSEADGAFQEVPQVPGGVLIVNRQVWDKIPRGPWFRWYCGENKETLDRGKGAYGEDTYFCNLVKQHGFKLWTPRQAMAGHYRTTDLTGMVCALSQMRGPAG